MAIETVRREGPSVYASATIYFASKKYLDRYERGPRQGQPVFTKQSLRNAIKQRGDLFEVNLIRTPVSPGGLVNLRTAFTLVDEIHVRSDDLRTIVGTIVSQRVVGDGVEPGTFHYAVR